jgi:biotin carboxyl carrier protein
MEYRLKIQDETIPVEINCNEHRTATATIENREYDLKYARISDNELHLLVNGKSVNVYLSQNKNGKTILLNGRTYPVQDEDKMAKGPKKKKGIDGPTKVTPPMPAVVIAVCVAAGDRVEKGQKVVVVSAMKMETALVAPYTGIVARVNVKESDKVMPGDILVDIDQIKDEQGLELENQ